MLLDIRIQYFRITVFLVLKTVKRYFNDMIISNAAFSQMIFEKRKQKIGFSASADSCDYFYKTVMFFGYQFRSVYKELHADHETGAADNK